MFLTSLEKVKKATLAMQRYSWEQGVVAQAFLECGDTDTALLLALEGANRQLEDGRCADVGNQGAVTDPCAIGEPLLFACEETGDPFLIGARDKLLHWALHTAPRSNEGVVYHLLDAPEVWVDSFYMLPPFLARAGHYQEALLQINGYWHALLDEEKQLLSHRRNLETGAFLRKDAWGVGNGWAMAGMARVQALLPDEMEKEKVQLRQKIQLLLDAALLFQMENGMFHDVLDDAATFPEVNFGQMMAYTVFRGVLEGWLPRHYLPSALRAREAALAQVDSYGLVRNVCGMPHFDRPFVAPEGQAFHLLMESAHQKLMG